MCLRSTIFLNELLQAQQGQTTRKNQNSNSSTCITVLSYPYVVYCASTHTQEMHDHPQLANGIYRSTNNSNNYNRNSNNDRINNKNNNSYKRFQERTESDHDSCYNNDSVKHRLNLNQNTCMSSHCHRNLNTINGNHNDDTNSIAINNTNSTANINTKNINIIVVMLQQCPLKISY